MSPSSNATDSITTEQGAADKRVESLLHQRYRGELPVSIAWNDTLDVLLSHRSTRAYLPDSLPEGTLETLVAAAQSAAQLSAILEYNQRLRTFQQEQGLPEQDWTEQAGNRVRDASSLSGRDVLREVLHRLGFALK
jgi:hypothetical protein